MDMTKDIFANCTYGQIALKELAPVSDNFRLYYAGWLEENPKDWKTMKVTGADFRVAKIGRDKGKLSVMIKGSKRSVFVSKAAILAFEASARQSIPA